MHVFRVSLVVCALVMTASAQITDSHGVILIDQQQALVGGIGPGDASGFPVTISTPGSYKLTSNLTVRDLNTTVIEIRANHVTLDLNGFSIMGPNVCAPAGGCPTTGNGFGVLGDGGPDITVKNGSVTGMGRSGIFLFRGGVIRNVTASDNGSTGIASGPGFVEPAIAASISDSIVTRNGGRGLTCEYGLVTRVVSTFNHGAGLDASPGCAYLGSVFVGNNGPQVAGHGLNLGQNSCNGVVCP